MDKPLSLEWTNIRNESLSKYLNENSKNLLDSCKKILSKNGHFGEYLCDNIITPNMSSIDLQKEVELFYILKTIVEMNPEYYFINFELHIKTNKCKATPMHSDRYTWMQSDKHIVNQAWILLYNDSQNNHLNLDLYENPTCGLLHGDEKMLVTLDGYKNFIRKRIYDGTSIKIGDILLFQNGIIHGTDPSTSKLNNKNQIYRMALAVSFCKRNWNLTLNLTSFYYKFFENDKTNVELSKKYLSQFKSHIYAKKILNGNTFIPLAKPEKVQKIQDIEWFHFLKNELFNIKF